MAINFPSTTGQATDGSFTHTASGVTWAWDGTSWQSQGVTGAYVLPTATATSLGGVKVGSGLAINSTTSVLSATASAITVEEEGTALTNAATTLNFVGPNVTATGTGATKTITISDSDTQLTTEQVQDIVGAMFTGNTETNITVTYEDSDGTIDLVASGGSGLDTRSTFTATTASLANNASGDLTVVAHKSYMLLKIKPSIAAWVVLYVDAASRTADTNRVQGADPAPDAGVIAEVITTTANQEVKMSPGVLGWHQDPGNDAVDTVFCKVVNKSGSTGTCTVSLTVVQLEA